MKDDEKMSIWRQPTTIEHITARATGTVNGYLGIRVTEIGPDYILGEIPVDERHVQPFGMIHGGVSVVLAETLGSLASLMACEPGFIAVGLEVNANHLRPVPKGDVVRGRCTPVRIGRSVHVWNIELRRGDGHLSCVSRLTTSIIEARTE
ncbi:PaaI family thioesterase [Roseococcus microcysteis]|uniref:PaaI family thioesterase n=1 Tax=Roseococcus microcysteis TaxID=2771361 RepID=UPI001CC7CC49|nr:hotdog fold thioesterase [Roseococcus microcysteis]